MMTTDPTAGLTPEELARVRLLLRRPQATTLTADEIEHLRVLLPLRLYSTKFWSRAVAVWGYSFAMVLLFYGVIMVLGIFFLGLGAALSGK